ncbi:hypothetical protein [Abyssogena phaseoliformis symbiont]|uniref:hypothetical protein n=1 Tax=Abyssogena phaseoliformis symbiont TaxID=596095 RepID=UPI001916B799|nr:hypothetical protein [Abyssogena phaseoliformis symbiont]
MTPIQLRKPSHLAIPSPAIIAKGEFETTKQFRIRLAQRKNIYQEKLNAIKQSYINKVGVYNTAIKSYNNEIYWEQKRRQEQVTSSMRSRLLNTAINEILGTLRLINVKYYADKEVFTARIVAFG